MITLFATTKSFTDIFKTIQLNALNSWRALSNDIQIIIFGDSVGSKKAAEEIGADFVPDVRCSSQGTPFLSDIFLQADKRAKFPIMAFINADIILPNNFLETIPIAQKRIHNFLMVGHRWDMDVKKNINFNDPKENKLFWEVAKKLSTRHECTGIDYFIFNRGTFQNLPNLTIGRFGWDNWLLWKTRRMRIPLIDVSDGIFAIHQNHSYVFNKFKGKSDILSGTESENNQQITKGNTLNILDCTHEYFEGKIRRKTDKASRIRSLHRLPMIFPELAIPIKLYRRLYMMFNYS